MRLSCLQENLAKGLSIVGRAVATKSTLPVLSNILLSTEGGRLKLAATNLEVAVTCWVGAKVEEDGTVTVPARLLSEFVNSLPNDRVDLVLNKRNLTLNLKCAPFQANIKGIDAEEFPPIPTVGDGPTASLDPESLAAAVGQVAFAAATDDTRPVLTGALLTFEGNELTMAAADGYRLAVRRVELADAVSERLDIVVPARSLQELARVLSGEHGGKGGKSEREPIEVYVTPNKSQVLFHMPNVDLVSRLVEGTFPNYRQIIPQRYVTRAVLSTSEFQKATRIASFFARDANNVVKLQLSPGEELQPGQITVAATAAEVGDAEGGISAVIAGEGIQIAFNVKYLTDVLNVIDADQLSLEVVSPSSPGVIKPVTSDNYIYVVMPMHLASR